ncbi:MAG: hypothetical protein AAFP86_14430, partial [Planctomycetota bacterium]
LAWYAAALSAARNAKLNARDAHLAEVLTALESEVETRGAATSQSSAIEQDYARSLRQRWGLTTERDRKRPALVPQRAR